MRIKPIRSEADYRASLKRIESLMDAPSGSAREDELDVLGTLVEKYEEDHYPVCPPDPIDAIKFRMDQEGLTRSNLIPLIGSRSKVSEVLNRRRRLNLRMIRSLNRRLRIPAEVLIGGE